MINEIKNYLSEQILEAGLNTAHDYDGIETDEDVLIYTKALIEYYKSKISPEVRNLMQEERKKLQREHFQKFMEESFPGLIIKEKPMKKYILKKNLPFAQAGEEVEFKDDEIHFTISKVINYMYFHCAVIKSEKDDWIEEVKPREFILYRNKHTGEYVKAEDFNPFEFYRAPMEIEIIKAIEV